MLVHKISPSITLIALVVAAGSPPAPAQEPASTEQAARHRHPHRSR